MHYDTMTCGFYDKLCVDKGDRLKMADIGAFMILCMALLLFLV